MVFTVDDVFPPLLIVHIPVNGLLYALVKGGLRAPAELVVYLCRVNGIAQVVTRSVLDPTKIHNELGWSPETTFDEGIKKTVDWYMNNKQWWEDIINGEYQNYYEKMYSNR